jgi:drug/metabolite transporter (DMT)-like permease
MIPSIRSSENLHILLWLIKDLFWLMEYRAAGLFMVAPTLAMAFYIAWRSRMDLRDLFNALAVICWITANSTWMIGDLFFGERGHGPAQAFFLAGLGLLALYYVFLGPRQRRRSASSMS